MNLDSRIQDRLNSICENEQEFLEAFTNRLKEKGEGVSFHLGLFNKQRALGFCGGPKDVYVSDELFTYPPMFLLFVLLHEVVHTGHDWKHACSLDYEGYTAEVNRFENEANGFAFEVLEELKEIAFEHQIDSVIAQCDQVISHTELKFDETYGVIYNTVGADLNFEDHVGELIKPLESV